MHRTDLYPQIIDSLKHEFQMVEQGKYLRGRCPECEKKSLWTWLDNPGHVQCDRKSKCNYEETTKDLFPELFEKLNEKYQPTETNPHATADAYLSLIRGFDTSLINGWYEQGSYYHPRGDKGTASVRFYLDDAKQIMWERLIDDVIITDEKGDKESRNKSFKGSFKGYWWQPPTLTINDGDEIWLVEGILDAIALNINGIKAVAIMSSGTFPDVSIQPYLKHDITWVIATDNDKAGRDALSKHTKRLKDMGEQVGGALSSSNDAKSDWNDLHKAGKLTEKDIHFYRYLGRLELANSYSEKAQMMWQHNPERTYFIFAYRNRTYAAKVDKKAYDTVSMDYWLSLSKSNNDHLNASDLATVKEQASKAQHTQCETNAFNNAVAIREIATFSINYLYFQQPDNGEDGQYYFSFKLANHGQERQIAFTHKTISAASDFKKSAMRIPGALFSGLQNDLDWLYKEWTRHNTKEVRTLDFIGYDKPSKTYVFNDYAVEGSRILKLNNQSFFQLRKEGIKTTVDIKQTLSDNASSTWLGDFKTAFGTKGLVTLSWWLGSLFAEQVRQQHRSYPFFELVGEAASGKSSLVDFLWKLLGKESESFNPNSSTLAGRTRHMSQVSNMPVVFNETDNENDEKNAHVKRFNWDEQKDLFDGEFGRVTGIKSQDNSTKKPTFKASLMIVQNIPVLASEAILTRICHLNFDTSHHSPEGYEASVRLNTLPIKDANGFMMNAIRQSDRVLKYFNEKLSVHRTRLTRNSDIKLQRIVENHAKMMAFADCLHGLYPAITKHDLAAIHKMIETMAEERQASLNEDTPFIQQFWQQFDYLNNRYFPGTEEGTGVTLENQLNHSTYAPEKISLNIEHFLSMCRTHNLPAMDPKELRRQLPSSKNRPFIDTGVVNSRLEKRSVRCWNFHRKK